MVLKVVLATEADAQRSADIEAIAYGPNPLGSALFPPAPQGDKDEDKNEGKGGEGEKLNSSRADQLIALLRADAASCRWVKVVDTEIDDPAQAMISFACWYMYQNESPIQGPQTWGPGTNPEACEAFFGKMRLRRNERFQGRPYAYLRFLHTHPDHKRRGAGSMLLRWGAEEADRLGLESYLEASPEGKPLYEKSGFVTVDTLTVDMSPWGGPADHSTALMMRPASK